MSTANNRKLLDEVRNVLRLLPYSIRTERTYCEWIRKFVHFHKMKSRDDLAEGEKKIEAVVKTTQQKDLEQGYGSVYLPHVLARKYKNAAKKWGWQYVLPSSTQSTDPLSNAVRRHHATPA